MKKTINISLGGMSFTVEDDAYGKLDTYLKEVRSHFSSYENSDEIINDIEARFAEQFSEKAGGVQVITLPEVEKLILAMGNPEDFEDGENTSKESRKTKNSKSKRLYRNPDDAVLAGVASGVAAYIGVDSVWLRLLFFLSVFFGGLGILLYVILWVITPEAQTETEKMQMRGEPINLKNLEEVLKEKAQQFKQKDHTVKKVVAVPFKVAKKLFGLAIKILGVFVTTGALLAAFGVVFTLVTVLINGDSKYLDFPLQSLSHDVLYYGTLISGFFFAIIPLLILVLLGTTITSGRTHFKKAFTFSLLGVWILAAITFGNFGIRIAPQVKNLMENSPEFQTSVKEIDAKDFDKIKLLGSQKIIIHPSSEYKVVAEGRGIDFQDVKVSVKDGTLVVEKNQQFKVCIFCLERRLTINVYAPNLTGINAEGASNIFVEDYKDLPVLDLSLNGASKANLNLTVANLNMKLSGANRVILSGLVENADIKALGTNRIDARNSEIKKSKVDLNGSSSLYLGKTGFVDVTPRGASRVYYVDPESK